MRKIFMLILVLSVVLSCGDISNTSKENLSEKDFNEIRIDNVFKLSVPKYMKEMNNINEEASLQYANVFKEVYALVIYENKEEFLSVFKELGEYDEELSVVENYKQTHLNYFEEIAVVNSIEPYQSKTINGLNAEQLKILAKVDGIDIAYIASYIEGRENVYQILAWTSPGRLNKYEDTFLAINNSFRLIKKKI